MPIVLQSAPDLEFITGDQPVMNTYAAFAPAGAPVEKIEFYYPVSPQRAIIFTDRPMYMRSKGIPLLSAAHSSYLNQVVERSAHHQLFAKCKESLMQPAMTLGTPRPW